MDEKNKNFVFDTSLLIIYITILFYLCAFQYKSGYLSYYQIPINFVSLDFSSLLSIASLVSFFIIGLINVLDLVFRFSRKKEQKAKKGFMFWGVGVPVAIIFGWFIGHEYWKIALSIPLVLLAIEFLFPFFMYKKSGLQYWERYDKIWTRKSQTTSTTSDRSDFQYWIIDRFGKAFYSACLSLLIFPAIFSAYARNVANNETFHTIIHLSSKPEMLIVDVQNNELLCKPFDRSKKTFDNNFFLIKKSECSDSIISSENIGRLKSSPP